MNVQIMYYSTHFTELSAKIEISPIPGPEKGPSCFHREAISEGFAKEWVQEFPRNTK